MICCQKWEGGQSLHSQITPRMYYEVIPGNLTEAMGEHCPSWTWSRAIPGQGKADTAWDQTAQSAVVLAPWWRSVQREVADTRGYKTDWVPLNKNPECTKCTPLAWIIPASPWTMCESTGDCGVLGGICDGFSARREGECFRHFIINMQYLATALEHLPCLCKWARPLLKHWWKSHSEWTTEEEGHVKHHYSCGCC